VPSCDDSGQRIGDREGEFQDIIAAGSQHGDFVYLGGCVPILLD
jgi:hypothetical protein